MKDEVSIKVKIADRVYPLKVSIEEEAHVRRAVQSIDKKIKDLKSQFDIKDLKDILSMIALEACTEVQKHKAKVWIEDDGVSQKIIQIDEMLKLHSAS